eukprot:jgi/Chlat1/4889/Chrsp31S04818
MRGASVMLTDLPEVLPHLRANIALNASGVTGAGGVVVASAAAWGEANAPTAADLGQVAAQVMVTSVLQWHCDSSTMWTMQGTFVCTTAVNPSSSMLIHYCGGYGTPPAMEGLPVVSTTQHAELTIA